MPGEIMVMKSIEPICQKVVQRLRETLGEKLISVALFGSYARGDYHQGSDLDLLVIAEGLPAHPVERIQWLYTLVVLVAKKRVGFVAWTPEEFSNAFPSLYLDFGLDARILFDSRGFLSERLKRVREIIEETGLYRVQNGRNFAWRFKKPPQRGYEINWEGYHEFK